MRLFHHFFISFIMMLLVLRKHFLMNGQEEIDKNQLSIHLHYKLPMSFSFSCKVPGWRYKVLFREQRNAEVWSFLVKLCFVGGFVSLQRTNVCIFEWAITIYLLNFTHWGKMFTVCANLQVHFIFDVFLPQNVKQIINIMVAKPFI